MENAKFQTLKCDILSGQKFTKSAENVQFWRLFRKLEVLPDRSILKGQKLVENAKIQMRMRHFQYFLKHLNFHDKKHFLALTYLNFRAKIAKVTFQILIFIGM